jgi:hypothetical protein
MLEQTLSMPIHPINSKLQLLFLTELFDINSIGTKQV